MIQVYLMALCLSLAAGLGLAWAMPPGMSDTLEPIDRTEIAPCVYGPESRICVWGCTVHEARYAP